MFTPTKDQYGRAIWTSSDPTVLTADRKPITEGMRVFTNNLDRGTVDLSRATYEWHGPENRWVLWFDVIAEFDYKGNPSTERVMQSHDRVATRFNGKPA